MTDSRIGVKIDPDALIYTRGTIRVETIEGIRSIMEASARMRWWEEARYGMFIHWGVYSIRARGEWVMYHEHIPGDEYAPLASKFAPRRFDPDAWVDLAREAGMRYMVMTSRHHDGFSLFDSQVSDFTAPKTAAGRDLLREYVEA